MDSRPATTTPTIPDYELIARIGSGAYGEVWLARNLATAAHRAVKIVYRATFTDERPFNREFEGIKKFETISHSHPSQLALFHVGKNDGAAYFYYVMELADDAPSMLSRLQPVPRPPRGATETQPVKAGTTYTPHTLRFCLEYGRLPVDRVLEIALTLTEALSHLHANGLIHRDVKPSNIIFIQGRPKLADIGLVTDASDSRSIVGTEGYLAPEGPGTPQADLFALGKVLYETLTGLDRRQFPELPEDLRSWPDHEAVIEFNEILLRACARDARERYAYAETMRADLELLQQGHSVKRHRSRERFWKYSQKLVPATIGLAIILVLIRWQAGQKSSSTDLQQPPPDFLSSTNALALEDYRKAVHALQVQGDNAGAVRLFKSAIQKDPNFAEAWARLAWAHYSYGESDPNPAEGPAAAEKAVQLNPKLAYAHSMLATARANELNWAAAEKERRLAISLNPNSQEILLESALNLAVMGRAIEAIQDLEKARRANPDSTSNTREHFYVLVYGWCGEYEKALEMYERLGVGGYWGFKQRSLAHLAAGDFPNFMRRSKEALLARTTDTNQINEEFEILERAFHDRGSQGFWELNLQFESTRRDYDHLMRLAAIHAQLNQPEESFRYIRKAMTESPSSVATGFLNNPCFDVLKGHKDFKAITNELWRPK